MQNELTVGRIVFAPAQNVPIWPTEETERLRDENKKLRAFAHAVMEVWPMGDLDGGTLQEIAEKHGMLKPETRHEPCGEGCSCAENADAQEWKAGVVCYRKTPLLKGPNVELTRLAVGQSGGAQRNES